MVACLAQVFGNGGGVGVQIALIGSGCYFLVLKRHHIAHSCCVGIVPGQQGSARGAAATCVVKTPQFDAIGGQFIQVGGLGFATVTTDVGVAQVIGHDEDDVGALIFCLQLLSEPQAAEYKQPQENTLRLITFHDHTIAVLTAVP